MKALFLAASVAITLDLCGNWSTDAGYRRWQPEHQDTALHDTNFVVTVIRNHGDIVMQDKTVRSVELSNYAL